MSVIITGASGFLGQHLVALFQQQVDHSLVLVQRQVTGNYQGESQVQELSVDLRNSTSLRETLLAHDPKVIIHLAALAATGECAKRPQDAWEINHGGTEALLAVAEACNAHMILLSSDWVFDAERAPTGGFTETATPQPASVYGNTKRAAEKSLLESSIPSAIIRSALMYGLPRGTTVSSLVSLDTALRKQQPLQLFNDEWRTPVFVNDVCRLILTILRQKAEGVFHCAGDERLSRYEFAKRYADFLNVSSAKLQAVPRSAVPGMQDRPEDLSLSTALTRCYLHFNFSSIEEAFAACAASGSEVQPKDTIRSEPA